MKTERSGVSAKANARECEGYAVTKKFVWMFMLLAVMFGAVSPSFAEETMPAAEAVMATTDAAAAVASAPVPDKGDTTWMMLSTLLVILMIVPGLSLFYGGLVRAKNMLSVLSQVFGIFALISILWVIYGYSLAFGDGKIFVQDLEQVIRIRTGEVGPEAL